MAARSILIALGMMLAVAIAGAVALVLYARSDDGASDLERLERSNPAWQDTGRYGTTVPPRPARE
ncbi:hypothetical protein [Azospirillum sp.]|uniref:hypothetical protein n=1 Tax=Azospirillum sp. TaxID=34012 RepID=UPI002D42CF28|nr:hypothetical protein [Azospirillum sp.]HYD69188.1 hypothetical protein [Azospirillum sp.]